MQVVDKDSNPLQDVTQIWAGSGSVCALQSVNGPNVVCWGNDNVDQLGDDGAAGADTPFPVSPLSTPAISLSLGVGTVPVLVPDLGTVAAFSAGRQQTCAATNAGVVCWGGDTDGLLGGKTSQMCSMTGLSSPTGCSSTPVPIQGLVPAGESP